MSTDTITLTREEAERVREALHRIKILAETSDGWEGGETFYVDAVRNIKAEAPEALEILNKRLGE